MHELWYSLDDLPAGRLRVRVRWPGYAVLAASEVDKRGVRHWHEIVGTELRRITAPIAAWQPDDATRWRWPNGIEPPPLPVAVAPSLAVINGMDFDAASAAAEMEEWREAARARTDDCAVRDGLPWWRDVTRIAYEPMGFVSLDHGEARIMRHLILEQSLRLDLRRRKTNAAVLADMKRTWADIYGAESRGDDWAPPLVPQPHDWADFDVVMGWFAEVSPSARELTVLRGRMLAPPVTWRGLGDEIGRSWQRAQQIYNGSIDDLVAAANRPRWRGEARIAAVRERNRLARIGHDDINR